MSDEWKLKKIVFATRCFSPLLLTAHHLPLSTHHLLLTVHYLPFTTHLLLSTREARLIVRNYVLYLTAPGEALFHLRASCQTHFLKALRIAIQLSDCIGELRNHRLSIARFDKNACC